MVPVRAKNGFSLIELLVVIAIIGVLAGILFPIFLSAKAASGKTTCGSNLKQLYAAFELYAQDWDGSLPCPGGQPGDLTYWAQETQGLDTYLRCRRMGSRSVFCCPSYTGKWKTPWAPRTYSMNSFLREPADVPYPGGNDYLDGIEVTSLGAPSETILLFEGIPADATYYDGEGYTYRCGNWTCVRGYYPSPKPHWQLADKAWHGRKNNYLMCDGHLMCREPERYPFAGPLPGKENLWYARKFRDEL